MSTQTTVIGWAEKRPPRNHWVMASWNILSPLRPVKTCRHGCCVSDEIASMTLPLYWRDLTPCEQEQYAEIMA